MPCQTLPKRVQVKWIARKGVLDLNAYIPGMPIEAVRERYSLERVFKLASNECQLQLPESIRRAIEAETTNLCHYPDGYARRLRQRLASKLNVPEKSLLFGNGAEECIRLIGQAFLDPGDNSLIPDPIFDAYETIVRLCGAEVVKVPMKDYRTDLEATLARVDARTKIVWLCSPANPTGTLITKDELDAFLKRLPDNVLVVLDEAYAEYVTSSQAAHAPDYLFTDDRVIGLRTFSKVYGLAGLRIGWILAHPALIEIISMVKLPFNVNRLAQAAAIAALEETAFLHRHVRMIHDERHRLTDALECRGAMVVPSEANFLFVRLPVDSDILFKTLLPAGIIVRPGSIWRMPDFIRLTVGTPEQNDTFLSALDEALPELPQTAIQQSP